MWCDLPGRVRLALPDVDLSNLAEAGQDDAAVHAAERAVHDWTATISITLQRESGKATVPGGPLNEIEFWRTRHMVLAYTGLDMYLGGKPHRQLVYLQPLPQYALLFAARTQPLVTLRAQRPAV